MKKLLLLMMALLASASGAWADTADVTYQIVYNGSNSISATVNDLEIGAALSLPNQLKRGYIESYTFYSDAACTVGNEITTVPASDNVTVYVKAVLSASCPITFSTDADPVWYVLTGKNNNDWCLYADGTNIKASQDAPSTDAHKWAFIGNPFAFKLKNNNGKYALASGDNNGLTTLDETGTTLGLFKNKTGGNTAHIAMATYDGTNQNVLNLHNGSGEGYGNKMNSFVGTTAEFSEGIINKLSNAFFYPYEYYEKAITSYFTKYVSPGLSNCGKVGYPSSDETAYTNLQNYCTTNFGATPTYNATTLSGLIEKFQALVAVSTVIMPTDGKVYKFTSIQKDGTPVYLYHKASDHTLGLSLTPITDGSELFVCHAIDAANRKYAFVSVNGRYMVGATGSNGQTLSETYNENKQECTITKHGTPNSISTELRFGLVQLKFKERVNNNSVAVLLVNKAGTWNGYDQEGVTDSYSSMFKLEVCSDYYNKVTLTTDNTDAYASLYLPFPVTIPDGVTAYAVTSQNGSYAHMDAMDLGINSILPKEKAAILKKDGQTSNSTIYLSPAEGDGTYTGKDNLLLGTVATEAAKPNPASYTTYVLGKIEGEIGLYEYTAANLAPGKAYLQTAAAGVKALAFDFGDANGIKAMDNGQLKMDNAHIFNLAGQRMNKLQRGVNIVNGKKIIVK